MMLFCSRRSVRDVRFRRCRNSFASGRRGDRLQKNSSTGLYVHVNLARAEAQKKQIRPDRGRSAATLAGDPWPERFLEPSKSF